MTLQVAACTGQKANPDQVVVFEEEHEWLPNPYQAQADAQMMAGAWPGTPLLMGLPAEDCSPWHVAISDWPVDGEWSTDKWPVDDSPCQSESLVLDAEDALLQRMSLPPTAMSNDLICWEAGNSWNYLFDYNVSEDPPTCGSSSALLENSTDEGDAETAESLSFVTVGDASTAGDKPSTEVAENDETIASERSRYSRKLSHQCVPKKMDLSKKFGEEIERDKITTLMVRNIPNMYTRSMLMEELDSLGFQAEYDFIYLPMDKSTQWNVGYAFVNFSSPSVAMRCVEEMTNYTFRRYDHGSGKVAQISIAHIQGLDRNMDYYSNTAVQCARISTYRPLALSSKQQDLPEAPQNKANRRRRRARPAAADGAQQAAGGRSQGNGKAYHDRSARVQCGWTH